MGRLSFFFFFSSRRRHTRSLRDWSSDVCSSDLAEVSRARAGLGLTVFIGLTVDGHSRQTSQEIEHALLDIPAVVACYLVSGSDDFLIEAAIPDLASYEKVLLDQILAIPA